MEALFGSTPHGWTRIAVPSLGMTVVPLGATPDKRLRLYPVPVAVLSTPRDLAVLVRLKTPHAGLAGGVEFVAEDPAYVYPVYPASAPAALGAAVAYELYSVPGAWAGAAAAGVSQYVLQVPSGMFDDPNAVTGGDTYTFLSHEMRYTAASYATAPRWPASALTLV